MSELINDDLNEVETESPDTTLLEKGIKWLLLRE